MDNLFKGELRRSDATHRTKRAHYSNRQTHKNAAERKQSKNMYSDTHFSFEDFAIDPIPLQGNSDMPSRAPKRLGNDGLLDILESVESIVQADWKAPVSPTPIGPNGLKNVVDQFDVTENGWHTDEVIVDNIRTLLGIRKREETSLSPHKKFKTYFALPFSEEVEEEQQATNDFSSGSKNFDVCAKNGPLRFRTYQSEQWTERFHDLVKFRKEHGHCLVPHKSKDYVVLAQWVKRQRYQYKLKKDGLHTTMTDGREDALEKLGFVWDSHAALWEERLNDIRTYKDIHGHCNVPSTCNVNRTLAIWVKCQRRQYKLFMAGNRSNMTRERITKLDQLGFVWNPRNISKSIL